MIDGRGKAASPAWGRGRLPPLRDPLHELSGTASMHLPPGGGVVIRTGSKVFEIGRGTGNLVLLVERLHADAWVAGPSRPEGARSAPILSRRASSGGRN